MNTDATRKPELTGFQEAAPYAPEYDLRSDFVMVYGINESMSERIAAWRARGYEVHLMTGVAWGQYQDYLNGEFDGRQHWDESQERRDGQQILHGPTVPYMSPSIAFTRYLSAGIRKAIDAGVSAIHLEEPEFWADAGYSPAFRREWQIYYGEEWQPPHTSPDAQYRSAKLKQYLYTRCLDHLCAEMKEYALAKYDRMIRFYVPTHSLVNYTKWRIVSPESKLIEIPTCDGYIAQIWTGTARTSNVYKGVRKERTFETAFLEYGCMQELVRGTGRHMWFLHDPIEDNPRHTWADYRRNYHCILTASLLHPDVAHYEISPWPRRVFCGQYPTLDGSGKEPIPPTYATELLTIMNTLRDMHGHECRWPETTEGIGVMLADTAMFQRAEPAFSLAKMPGDPTSEVGSQEARQVVHDWSAFYGMALPLIKHGIPARPVQLENIGRTPNYLDDYRVLFLSYEFQKPSRADFHFVLAQWVQAGGVLVYIGDGSDVFHGVREWWNQGTQHYSNPAQHLFTCLGLPVQPANGVYQFGKGAVVVDNRHPAWFAGAVDGPGEVLALLRRALEARGEAEQYIERPYFLMRRGPYVIAAAMDETDTGLARQCVIPGRYIDLLSADLPVVTNVHCPEDTQVFLLDLDMVIDGTPQVLAAAARVENVQVGDRKITYTAETPLGVMVNARLWLPSRPQAVKAVDCTGEQMAIEGTWDEASSTLVVRHPGRPTGVRVQVVW